MCLLFRIDRLLRINYKKRSLHQQQRLLGKLRRHFRQKRRRPKARSDWSARRHQQAKHHFLEKDSKKLSVKLKTSATVVELEISEK